MTGLTTAQLLAAGLVLVYLLDSMHFLCLDEAVLRTRGGRLATLSFGSGLELGGRRPFLPNPFTPHRPEFRLQLDLATASAAATPAGWSIWTSTCSSPPAASSRKRTTERSWPRRRSRRR